MFNKTNLVIKKNLAVSQNLATLNQIEEYFLLSLEHLANEHGGDDSNLLKCEVCGKRIAKNCQLIKHMRVHTGMNQKRFCNTYDLLHL